MLDSNDIRDAAPGLIGALVAALWSRDTPLRLAAAMIGGSAASYYGGAALANWLAPKAQIVGFVSFLIGVFGMAIGSKIFETIQGFDLRARVERWFEKRGL